MNNVFLVLECIGAAGCIVCSIAFVSACMVAIIDSISGGPDSHA